LVIAGSTTSAISDREALTGFGLNPDPSNNWRFSCFALLIRPRATHLCFAAFHP
jgi:hypothetical protein